MKIYMITKDGKRAEGDVVLVNSKYTVDTMRIVGEVRGWDMYTRSYKTLAGLLSAVGRNGHFIDTASAGIF